MHMSPSLASHLFLKAVELGMMSIEYSWIITDGLSNLLTSMNSSIISSMQGVLAIRPYFPKSKELDHFKVIWRRKYLQENLNIETSNSNVLDLWAYDTVWALAMTAEKVGCKDSHFLKPKTNDSMSKLGALGVSQIGPKLIGKILESKLKVSSTSRYSTSKANLGNITWPRESSIVPKGWVIPESGTLRVGVLVIKGFCSELVDNTSSLIVENYNDLIYQVFLHNYDIVVGDITIIANCSLYADFSLPFTESGVLMVVPVKGDERKNAWIFLKPLTLELWFATSAFVIFIGFVVWILEHRVNDEFRGVPTTKPSPGHDLLVFLLDN
ncbi:hypothetical protein GIB67_039509 [Kingdonia uniflora]|uniref:Receptor ligand binding region domain-containing protein n=1 Tax=Kingdonia uniflora TaxID=39325 RepID=A0A7J7LIR4_9MAGN|nr:hypothetical protein GIB67_039509 [Kingdonia uniflora]